MLNFGYVPAGTVLRIPFATFGSSGQSITLTGLAVTDIEIYKDGSVTQRASDAGYALLDTDGIDFDGITGIHGFSIDTGDNTDSGFYAAGSFYWCVVSAVTINAQTVNFIAATWWIGPIAANATQFAGQTITAAAGVTLPSSVASPTNITAASGVTLAAVTHTGAVIPTVSAVTGLTASNLDTTISSRMATYTQPTGFLAATFPGTVASTTNITAGTITTTTNLTNLPAITTDWLTGTGIAASGVTKIQAGLATPTNITAGTITTATNVTTVNGLAANVITAASMAADASAEIADQVWDEVLSGHLTAGTTGTALNGAGSAGDPWGTSIPGAYTAGQAGYILGTNLNATVSTRATQTSVDDLPTNAELSTALGAADDATLVQIALVKAKTDLIPAAPAAVGDIPTAAQNATAVLTTAMTESYAADGATFTLAQGMYAVHQYLMGFDIATVNYSVKKLDGTTQAFVVTLNDGTTPTGAIR